MQVHPFGHTSCHIVMCNVQHAESVLGSAVKWPTLRSLRSTVKTPELAAPPVPGPHGTGGAAHHRTVPAMDTAADLARLIDRMGWWADRQYHWHTLDAAIRHRNGYVDIIVVDTGVQARGWRVRLTDEGVDPWNPTTVTHAVNADPATVITEMTSLAYPGDGGPAEPFTAPRYCAVPYELRHGGRR